jgi:hypothetical protein
MIMEQQSHDRQYINLQEICMYDSNYSQQVSFLHKGNTINNADRVYVWSQWKWKSMVDKFVR